MNNMNLNVKVTEDVMSILKELIEKHGMDTNAWKDEMNSWPMSKREMTFTFATNNSDDAVVLTLNFIFSNIGIKINDPQFDLLEDI
jgi:hypothetical protein